MDIEQLKKLARLAHINVKESDLDNLKGDLESILGYVTMLDEVTVDSGEMTHYNTNVMREDVDPFDSETYTKDLLDNAPATQDGYVKVPKIL